MNIQKSTDYGQFLPPTFQRPVKESKVQKYMESMRKRGFDYSQPIAVKQVGKFLQLIRGQHRLEAASRIGLPVYFIIKNDLDESDAIEVTDTGWSPADTVAAYADAGYSDYVYLREFSNRQKLPLVLAARLLADAAAVDFIRKALTSGTFAVTSSGPALKVVEVLDSIGGKWKFCRVSNFIGAIQAMFLNPGVNWKHFTKRMVASTVVPEKRTSILEYLNLFEEIYNFRLPSTDRIPLAFYYQQGIADMKVKSIKVARRSQLSSVAQKQKSREERKSAGHIIAGMKSLFTA
jgi:hypothetical protein